MENIMKIHNYHECSQTLARVGLLPLAGIIILMAGCASMPAPTEQIAVSKAALTCATSAGSNEYAPVELKSATEKMNAAEKAMAKEDYIEAQRLAEQAQLDAKLAETKLQFASNEYFDLVTKEKDLAQYFALGEQVVIVWKGRVYRIIK